jgi:GNAT superfamily N-acetyltransferase
MTELLIRPIEQNDIQPIALAFVALGWNKPASQYEQYLLEQEAGQRLVLVAFVPDLVFAGYVTICWQSDYIPFREQNIPEIVDFNVLPQFRRQGIGSALMDDAETRVAAVSPTVGIGVGMTGDYGSAQRMYARRGYIPDGRGLISRGQPVQYGQTIPVDDDLALYFTKFAHRRATSARHNPKF